MQTNWITMETLGTFGGVVFVVTLICQFLKVPLDTRLRIPTRLLALVVSWGVLAGKRALGGGDLHFDGLFLDALNGFLVALAAMGAHSFAKDNFRWK